MPTSYRRLKVMAWYPAASVEGCRRRRYLDPRDVEPDALNVLTFAQVPNEDLVRAAALETASHGGAPVAPGRFPVLVFCHGALSYPQQNMTLFEYLASHGYLVVSVAHPHESATHALADGTTLVCHPDMRDDASKVMSFPRQLSIYFGSDLADRMDAARASLAHLRLSWYGRLPHMWADDLVFVVDRLAGKAVSPAAAPVAEAADLEHLAYFGMSYGGHVAALCCLKDPRARAGANFDGGFFTAEVLGREIGVPFLCLMSDRAQAAKVLEYGPVAPPATDGQAMLDLLYARMDGTPPAQPVHRLIVRNALHMDFTDLPSLFGGGAGLPGRLGDVPTDRLMALQFRITRDFFDTYVRGESRDFPREVAAEFDDLVVAQDHAAMLARRPAAQQA